MEKQGTMSTSIANEQSCTAASAGTVAVWPLMVADPSAGRDMKNVFFFGFVESL